MGPMFLGMWVVNGQECPFYLKTGKSAYLSRITFHEPYSLSIFMHELCSRWLFSLWERSSLSEGEGQAQSNRNLIYAIPLRSSRTTPRNRSELTSLVKEFCSRLLAVPAPAASHRIAAYLPPIAWNIAFHA